MIFQNARRLKRSKKSLSDFFDKLSLPRFIRSGGAEIVKKLYFAVSQQSSGGAVFYIPAGRYVIYIIKEVPGSSCRSWLENTAAQPDSLLWLYIHCRLLSWAFGLKPKPGASCFSQARDE